MKNRQTLTLLTLIVGSFLSISTQASSVHGKIKSLVPHTGNIMFVYVDSATSGFPGCASGGRYVINSTDKVLISNAMLAFALDKTVDIQGEATCGVWGDSETLRYISYSN